MAELIETVEEARPMNSLNVRLAASGGTEAAVVTVAVTEKLPATWGRPTTSSERDDGSR